MTQPTDPQRLTRRQQQAFATRRRILEAASVLFREAGYDNVKVTDVCKAAGVSVGAFYHHFSSKEDIIDQGYKGIDALMRERLASREFADAREGIRIFMGIYCDIFEEIGCDVVTQFCHHLMAGQTSNTLNKERFLYAYLRGLITAGLERGEIVSVFPPEEILDRFFRLAHGVLFDWCMHSGAYPLKKTFLEDMDLLLSHGRDDLYLK